MYTTLFKRLGCGKYEGSSWRVCWFCREETQLLCWGGKEENSILYKGEEIVDQGDGVKSDQ